MTKRLYLPLLMALVVALSSCSSKMGELSSDYFTVTPQVLEAVVGKVPVTINVCSIISEVEITPSATFTAGIVTVLLPIVALNSRYNSDLAISGT